LAFASRCWEACTSFVTTIESLRSKVAHVGVVGRELKGRREVRLETIDGLLRAGLKWPVILSATGIDEPTYRALKRDAANGTEQTAPRQSPVFGDPAGAVGLGRPAAP